MADRKEKHLSFNMDQLADSKKKILGLRKISFICSTNNLFPSFGHTQGKVTRQSPNLVRLMDDYSIVIQEFFQKRVQTWLETVGKKVFDIKHHWTRFEFAPARGQIHAHLLGICGNQSVNIAMHQLRNDKKAQAEFLQNWTRNAYDYTAEVDVDSYDQLNMDNNNNPCIQRASEVADIGLDGLRLQCFCQDHGCSGYCLRKKRGKKLGNPEYNCRECRTGAGQEATPGQGDTPGFMLRECPQIVTDKRGFQRIELERNHKRVLQSSLDMLRTWRGNCDFQFLIYDSDPKCPDPTEIARVTDYVVSYTCKGNQKLKDEKKELKSLILKLSDDTGTQHDVVKLSRHLLNRAASNRTVSKQECMVLLAGLDLVMCSETIETVSISGQYRIQEGKNTTIFKKYEQRLPHLHDLSLDAFFHHVKNSKGGKLIIPHYVGGRSQPVYPATEGSCLQETIQSPYPRHGPCHVASLIVAQWHSPVLSSRQRLHDSS